jgi:nucleoside phosphorylase
MAQEKRGLRQASGADAVEMESAHIRGICREAGIPSATVRVILDRADEDLPMDFNQLMNADYSLSFTKLALLLIRSPGKIKQLLALQKQSRDAAERLAVVLEQFTA